MRNLTYCINFYSDWHCGSGLSAGTDVDLRVIRDECGLPYVPGKTVKGLLRDAAETLKEAEGEKQEDFIEYVFGRRAAEAKEGNESDKNSTQGFCFFTNAELSGDLQKHLEKDMDHKELLFRKIASTAIDEKGQANNKTLRKIEVVIPLNLFGRMTEIPDEYTSELERCMKMVKRLGSGRNRGYGRCDISIYQENSQ